ncbi:serine/threonine-protein kinase [Nocardia yamanashiensis]|uniref:serine/threonine-protein kinase n=1 Tax=Nocardia yamanashiensis TaxID=209247 RepID=UPI0012FD9051|nr:serine/threonine-protein kinase [Nocardia yamanashiensis]
MLEPLAADEPAQVGRYRILGVLGRGGMGRVLLGIGPDGRFVAIKQIHAHLLGNQEYRDRFANEVTISARVSGAFAAAVIDYSTAGDTPWLASVFIPGVALDKAVENFGPLPVSALRTLASGLASALHSIHDAGLVHRDLKPANVILAADGPRVIDFGIAQMVGDAGELTGVGVVGSVSYMSPEQATRQQITSASDIFSLGTLLYCAATGVNPFAASLPAQILANVVNDKPRLERVPVELRDLVGACLRKDPAARPTPAQILDHLGVLSVRSQPWPPLIHRAIEEQAQRLRAFTTDPDATQVIVPAVPAPLHPAAAHGGTIRPRRRRGLVLGALAAVVIAVIGGAVVFLRDGPAGDGASGALPALAELRTTDMCGWLKQALGPVLPAEVVTASSGAKRDIAAWRWGPTVTWGCIASSGGDQFAVEIGQSVDRFAATGAEVNGFELIRRGTECAFAVANGSTEQRWGVTVVTSGSGECLLARHILDRLTATLSARPAAADARSLAVVDPCALLTDSEITTAGAAGPGIPEAHGCVWRGGTSVELQLELPRQVDVVTRGEVVELDNGIVIEQPNSFDSAMHCQRLYRFRAIDETYVETVTALVISDKQDGSQCATATSVLTAAIARLPKK